jgi:hypothetical protein
VNQEAKTAADGRVWERYPSKLYTLCHLIHSQDTDPLPARVQNISPIGINLIVKRPVEAGVMLSVLLPGLEEGCESNVLTYVNNVRLNEEGEWSLGCTFALELDQETLGVFGAVSQRPRSPDQRAWTRFPCSAQARYEQIGTGPVRGTARVVDVAAAGLGLLADRSLTVGALLTLEIESPNRAVVLTILGSVVRVTSLPAGQWRVGCTFIRELNDLELKRVV